MPTMIDLRPGSISCDAPDGKLTLRPWLFSLFMSSLAFFTARVEPTMKMRSRTRKMSVSRVTVVSAEIASSRTSRSASGSFAIATLVLRALAVVVFFAQRAGALGPVLVELLEELVGQHLELDR